MKHIEGEREGGRERLTDGANFALLAAAA